MARTRLNPKRAKLTVAYTVEEVARLYSIHRNTVRHWIKRDDLATLGGGRPILIMGEDLRAFLEARRANAKRPCPPGHLYCLSCQGPRRPAADMVDFIPRERGAGGLIAICEACGTTMHRRAKRDALAQILPGIPIRIEQARLHITEPSHPFSNCDLEVTAKP